MLIDNGVLIYDDADDRCTLFVKSSQGKLYAFLTCIDKGCPKETKQYWGEWDWNNQRAAIESILESGGKWEGWNVNGIN